MILLGDGALVIRAYEAAKKLNVSVDCVVCSPGDLSAKRLGSMGARVVESAAPNQTLAIELHRASEPYVLSVNNRTILADALLDQPFIFLNIHNGLTQRYRGIAEVCVFAAICHKVEEYGATVHRMLPRQLVDTGPIVVQRRFGVSQAVTFEALFRESLANVQELLTEAIERFRDPWIPCLLAPGSETLKYSSVARLIRETPSDRVLRACELGVFQGMLPKLTNEISRAMLIG